MLSRHEIEDIFAGPQAIITGDHFVYVQKPDGWYHGSDYVNKDAIYPFTNLVSALCREIALHFCNCGIQTVVGPTVGAVSLAQWTAHWLNQLPHVLSPQTAEVMAVCADEEDVLEARKPYLSVTDFHDSHSMIHNPLRIFLSFKAQGKVEIQGPDQNGVFTVNFQSKIGTQRIIKRGYGKHVKGKRCLIVEDVINSGVTVTKTRDAILRAEGEIVGVGCLCNRSGKKVTAETLCVPSLFALLDVDMKMFKEKDCPICLEKGRGSVRLDLGKGKEFLARLGLKPGDK